MSLTDGSYLITTATEAKYSVGRPLGEDLSLLPKRVVTLDQSQGPPRPWVATKSKDDDSFILKVDGAPTADIDDKLFAILLEEPSPTEWKITPVPQSGPDAYIVTTMDGFKGWVVPEEEPFSQIHIRPLIVGLSEPPFYPPNEVFIFKRAEND